MLVRTLQTGDLLVEGLVPGRLLGPHPIHSALRTMGMGASSNGWMVPPQARAKQPQGGVVDTMHILAACTCTWAAASAMAPCSSVPGAIIEGLHWPDAR